MSQSLGQGLRFTVLLVAPKACVWRVSSEDSTDIWNRLMEAGEGERPAAGHQPASREERSVAASLRALVQHRRLGQGLPPRAAFRHSYLSVSKGLSLCLDHLHKRRGRCGRCGSKFGKPRASKDATRTTHSQVPSSTRPFVSALHPVFPTLQLIANTVTNHFLLQP